MTKKLVIGLVGEIASGKGTAVNYLEEKYQASAFRFSTVLRDVLERLHLEINRQNLQTISLVLRQNFGDNLLAKAIANDAKNANSQLIVIDGIRRLTDLEYLKLLPEFKLAYITASPEIRYQRLIKRSENTDDKNKTYLQFLKDHQAETELAIPQIGLQAEYLLDNSGSIEALEKNIDLLIEKYR